MELMAHHKVGITHFSVPSYHMHWEFDQALSLTGKATITYQLEANGLKEDAFRSLGPSSAGISDIAVTDADGKALKFRVYKEEADTLTCVQFDFAEPLTKAGDKATVIITFRKSQAAHKADPADYNVASGAEGQTDWQYMFIPWWSHKFRCKVKEFKYSYKVHCVNSTVVSTKDTLSVTPSTGDGWGGAELVYDQPPNDFTLLWNAPPRVEGDPEIRLSAEHSSRPPMQIAEIPSCDVEWNFDQNLAMTGKMTISYRMPMMPWYRQAVQVPPLYEMWRSLGPASSHVTDVKVESKEGQTLVSSTFEEEGLTFVKYRLPKTLTKGGDETTIVITYKKQNATTEVSSDGGCQTRFAPWWAHKFRCTLGTFNFKINVQGKSAKKFDISPANFTKSQETETSFEGSYDGPPKGLVINWDHAAGQN